MTDSVAEILRKTLGPLKRYVYSASPVVLFVKDNDVLVRRHGYAVDFEYACDMLPLDSARSSDCMYNPHLVNVVEPGVDGNEVNTKVSHCVFFDDQAYDRLLLFSNTKGKLHKYTGVIEGYAIHDIKQVFDLPNIIDTGVCVSNAMIESGCVRQPDVSFNENRHIRYIQASESYVIKLRKHSEKNAVSDIYQPEILTLDDNYELNSFNLCEV